MARQIILQAVSYDIGLRQDAGRLRQMTPENVLNERVMRAAENSLMRCLSGGCTQKALHGRCHQAIQVGIWLPLLNRTGELGTGLLYDAHTRAALPDLLRINARCDRSLGTEDRND